jgi:hypothetical protein
VSGFLAALDGARGAWDCPGGCDAEAELVNDGGGLFRIKVMHDDDCPWFLAYTARTGQAPPAPPTPPPPPPERRAGGGDG